MTMQDVVYITFKHGVVCSVPTGAKVHLHEQGISFYS